MLRSKYESELKRKKISRMNTRRQMHKELKNNDNKGNKE
jgi:hypothetical protein